MGAKHQKVWIPIPKKLAPAERLALGEEIVEFIRQSTEKGLNPKKKGKVKMTPAYSKAYRDSLEFKIAGKSKGKVDMRLSGDMMAEMEVLAQKKGQVLIGFQAGSEANAKADGNIRGTYGQPKPNKKKARDFLGIHPSWLKQLADKFISDPEAAYISQEGSKSAEARGDDA